MSGTKPRVAVSACLGFEACRWDGTLIDAPHIAALAVRLDLIPVCPEILLGLGTPRGKIRLVGTPGSVSLIARDDGNDFTAPMREAATRFIHATGVLHGGIFKCRSPSCAVRDAGVFSDSLTEASSTRGPGLFVRNLSALLPGLPMEDDETLLDAGILHRFLERIDAHAMTSC